MQHMQAHDKIHLIAAKYGSYLSGNDNIISNGGEK